MRIVTTKTALRAALAPHRGASIGFVPTMGYLHAGHVSLMDAARTECDVVVASIFVNPTQFGPNEDLDAYPRDPEGDAEACRNAGVDVLWMPPVADVYDPDHSTTVHVDGLTNTLCGRSRPGHFDGVTTIVTKLFNLVQPTHAYFGEKDFQQLAVIRRMVRDLDMPLEVVGMPIVREPDGLAMSSRNAYLSPDERRAALVLSRALGAVRRAFEGGERRVATLRTILGDTLAAEPLARTDYAELLDAESLTAPSGPELGDARPTLCALAVFVGRTRLIDNTLLVAGAR
jgi:pantoate--beta-alanine ligase